MAMACLRLSGFFLAIATSLTVASQPAITYTNTPLKSEPYLDSETISELEKGTAIEILSRKGGWYQIKSTKESGWLKIYSVRLNKSVSAMEKSGDSGIEQAGNFLITGRSGSNSVSASTGIRGLDEENLNAAKPDSEAIEQLDRLTPTQDEISNFSHRRRLNSNQIDYFNEVEIENDNNPSQAGESASKNNDMNDRLGSDYD